LDEPGQFALVESTRVSLDAALSLSAGDRTREQDAYGHVLTWKGLISEAIAARRAAVATEATRSTLAEIVRLRGVLQENYHRQVPPNQVKNHSRLLRETADQLNNREVALARAVSWNPQALNPQTVAALLPERTALIDLFLYLHHDRPPAGARELKSEARFVAFVVRKGREPQRVDLGPARAIDDALSQWRQKIQRDRTGFDTPASELARRLWSPVEPLLTEIDTVLIAPDDLLNGLPWGALPDPKTGRFLIERFAFGTVISARQLARLVTTKAQPAGESLLAVGGVDYGHLAAHPVESVRANRSAPLTRASLSWRYLNGTKEEVESIAKLYEQVLKVKPRLIIGQEATRIRVRAEMTGKRYLELATHGYFAPAIARAAGSFDLAKLDSTTAAVIHREDVPVLYPGLLSGLVWAGANDPVKDVATGVLDLGAGVMTAEEVEALSLAGCELVVLSACETGLGQVAGGEGVLGLQRAFQLAGARTVVASLWKVDDQATQALLTRFHRNLWEKKMAKLEALREAQIWLIREGSKHPELGLRGGLKRPEPKLMDGDSVSPFYWAAFVLSGDWR
jgi:CHAT domain-containing protein